MPSHHHSALTMLKPFSSQIDCFLYLQICLLWALIYIASYNMVFISKAFSLGITADTITVKSWIKHNSLRFKSLGDDKGQFHSKPGFKFSSVSLCVKCGGWSPLSAEAATLRHHELHFGAGAIQIHLCNWGTIWPWAGYLISLSSCHYFITVGQNELTQEKNYSMYLVIIISILIMKG